MMKHGSCSLFLAISAVTGQALAADVGLRKVWDLDLRKVVEAKHLNHTRDLPVFGLRFSPNGRRLAAIVDLYGPTGKESSRLLVLDVHNPQLSPKAFDIIGLVGGENGPAIDEFGWSPSGQAVYAGGAVMGVDSGTRCELPWRSLLINDRLAVSADESPWVWGALTSHLAVFDSGCRPAGAWDEQGKWAVADVSPDRGLLSISQILEFPNKGNHLIVDATSQKILQRWKGSDAGEFADSGKAICAGSDVEASERAPVTCWDVDTGKKINEAPTVNGGDPIAAALHASRIVASDFKRRRMPLSSDYLEVLQRRAIWGFRSGKELVSWRPKFQSWDLQLDSDPSKPPKRQHEPFRFAISPDGEYVAEGGAGGIQMYRIGP